MKNLKNFISKYLLNKFTFILIFVTILFVLFIYNKNKNKNITLYEEIPVIRGDLQISILSTGTVNPNNRLNIKSPVAGRAERVLVVEGQRVKKGQNLVLVSSSERAALIDAARLQGKEEVKRWEELYKVAPITSPINGTVIFRQVEPGQSFTISDNILVLSDRLVVKAQVDETDVSQIKINQKAKIILDAYPDKIINGRAIQIAFDARTINNVTTYIVDVLPDVVPEFMRSGMTTNVNFEVGFKKNILLIPNRAIISDENKYYVLVRDKNDNSKGKITKLPPVKKFIKLGISNGTLTEIIQKKENDIVQINEKSVIKENNLNKVNGNIEKKENQNNYEDLSENEIILFPLIENITKDSGGGGTNPFSPFSNKKKKDKGK